MQKLICVKGGVKGTGYYHNGNTGMNERVKSILIVEDDALIAMNLSETLKSYGYVTEIPVATAEEAILRAREHHPDLILMDIQLAGKMSGVEAAGIIRKTEDIPVIYLTAFSDDERLKAAINTAPYAYLIKPVQNQELRTSIEVSLFKHRIDKALRESEERYHAVVSQAMEGIIIYDRGTRAILETNPAVRSLSGYSKDELLTMNIADLLPGLPAGAGSMTGQATGEQIKLGEMKLLRKNRESFDVECTASVIRNAGKRAAVCLIAHDVTERKRAEIAFSEANKKLNLMSELTRHDLLNQIMALKGYFQFSKSYIMNQKHAELVQKEEEIIRILEKQIIFTRDYQNMGIKKPVWQNVAALVNIASSDLSEKTLRIDTGRPDLEIFGDSLLEKVFFNMIDNALRHGDGQLTSIRFSSQETDDGLILSCEDDGPGVPADQKELIFNRGFGKNTGLGLFLVREILGITGMTIRETGIPGTGARFEITVPRGVYRFVRDGKPVAASSTV